MPQLQNDPGKLSIFHQKVRATAQKFIGHAGASKQSDQIRQVTVAAYQQQIRGAADTERSTVGKRGSADTLDAEFGESLKDAGIVKFHRSVHHTFSLLRAALTFMAAGHEMLRTDQQCQFR